MLIVCQCRGFVLVQARDSSVPSSPVSIMGGSPPRHEVFCSSPPKATTVAITSSVNQLNGDAIGLQVTANGSHQQPIGQEWNSIDEQAWREQGAYAPRPIEVDTNQERYDGMNLSLFPVTITYSTH